MRRTELEILKELRTHSYYTEFDLTQGVIK